MANLYMVGGNVLDGIHYTHVYHNGQDINGSVDFNKAYTDNFGRANQGRWYCTSYVTIKYRNTGCHGGYTVISGDTLLALLHAGTTVDA